MTTENSAAKIAELAVQAAGNYSLLDLADGRQFIIHPPGYVAKDVTRAENVEPPMPKYIKQHVSVQTKASLVDYIERFKTDSTVVFANIAGNVIEAVIDYHGASVGDVSKPAIGSHRAILELAFSTPWELWCGIDGSMFRQTDFAKHIEENSEDILSPAGASLLEMVLDLEKSKTVRVVRKMRTAGSDDGQSGNTVEVNGTELPSIFTLSMPVYFGESPVQIKAFTRDALSQDKIITIGFKLARLEVIRQTEFLRVSQEIATATSVPMIAGSVD